jgi:hypothetical protein
VIDAYLKKELHEYTHGLRTHDKSFFQDISNVWADLAGKPNKF